MINKLKSLSVILFIIFSFYLLTEISIPVQATTSKTVQVPIKVSASVNNKTPLQNTIVNITINGPAASSVKIGRAAKGFKMLWRKASGALRVPQE
jgi:hypothetical protein